MRSKVENGNEEKSLDDVKSRPQNASGTGSGV
jgi:hypothetical protein